MQSGALQGKTLWAKRIDRATELAQRNPWAEEVLGFYARILEFQRGVYEGVRGQANQMPDGESELRKALDLEAAAGSFPELLALVRKHGPSKLAESTIRLGSTSHHQIHDILKQWLLTGGASEDGDSFFARVLLQPQAERFAQAASTPRQGVAGNKCPNCKSNPQLAIIRPEGDGGKRSLLCSFCQSEWECRRILCPACGEEHNEKLPRYSAEGIAAVRVEGCDTCKRYLKSVDLTVDGLAVPVVDEIATAPLDLWAAERVYQKIESNIMGF